MSATVEIARDPALLDAGDRVGAFLAPVDSDIGFFGDRPDLPTNAIRWDTGRIPAGSYYWHAKVAPYDGRRFGWSPIRRLTVVDEPLVLVGSSARVRRLQPSRSCTTRRQLRLTFAFQDNERTLTANWVIRVAADGRHVRRFTGRAQGTPTTTTNIFCSRYRRFTVTLTVRDRGGHAVTRVAVVRLPG